MKILLFALANILLITVVMMFVFVPQMRDINHLQTHITWQESQYITRTMHDIVYEDNLRELESLQATRRLLTYEEQPLALETIYQAATNHSLHSLRFDYNNAGFYEYGFGQLDELHIVTENDVADVLLFLYALANTHANILSADIVWDETGAARIHMNMSLISAGEQP